MLGACKKPFFPITTVRRMNFHPEFKPLGKAA
jgi:hypothetical protein